jgi:RNA polymerase sigma-70 factor (ECF subfamily)
MSGSGEETGRLAHRCGWTPVEPAVIEPEPGPPGGETSADQRLSPHRVRELYERWSADVLAFLCSLTRNRERADDLVQATFQRLAEKGHTARPASIRGWLLRVAHAEAMQVLRREGVARKGLGIIAPLARLADDATPWSPLVSAEDVARVREALAELPTEQRTVVEGRIWGDKTFATIAAEEGVPIGTVMTRMRLALAKLQARLRDDGTPG